MKTTVQHIAAAAMLVVVGTAQAADVTVATGAPYNGMVFTGASTLSFSSEALVPLDTAKLTVVADGYATATLIKDSDDYWVEVSVAAPMASLTIDSATNAVSSMATRGGMTLTTTRAIDTVTSGGSLTVTDLRTDLVNKLVYGTVTGANGLGTKTEALWNIGSITGATTVAGVGYYTTKLTGLTLTDAGLTDFSTALGLGSFGQFTLGAVTDFGSITSTIIASAVPEPSTDVMMGLGLVGMSLVARRRKSLS